MKNSKNISRLWLAIFCVLVFDAPAHALDPNQPASSFLRTHFNTDNGLPVVIIDHIEQTPDGFLWLIGNGSNLLRFDGRNFHRFPDPRPTTLAVSPDGDLWAGSREGLIRIPSSSFNQFTLSGLTSYHAGAGKADEIVCLRFTRNGVLWVGTMDGLFRFEKNHFAAVGPRVPTHQIHEAPDGHLLVINSEGVMELADSEIVPHPGLAAQLGVRADQIFSALRDKHGNTWYCTATGVARETNGRIEKLGVHGPLGHKAFRAHEDPQGTVWFVKEDGLFRATANSLELVAGAMQIRFINSDRDGNLWVGTNGDGLHRFKERAVRMFTTADGLPKDVIKTVIAARDGTIWAGTNCGGVVQFDGTRFRTYNEKHGLGNSCIMTLAEDRNGDIWIGTFGGAFRYHNGSITEYTNMLGMVDNRFRSILAARDGSVWFGTGTGLARLKDGQVRTYTRADGLSADAVIRIFEDRSGTILIGSRQGLDRLAGDRFENVASIPKGLAVPLGEDRDGGLLLRHEVNSEALTRRLDKDRFHTIKEVTALDMIETEQGELWLGGDAFGRVQPGNFAPARPRDETLDYEAFSTADGLATAEMPGPGRGLALTPDGKLYAATTKGLAMFDLRRLPVTNAKPSIYLRNVTIGRNIQPATGEVVLAPGTNHVRIDFAAVEISAPEKIRLQYRLDGVDSEWLDAPNSQAIYTHIPPGRHTLYIRACNRNGVWDRQGVAFSIAQQPFFYQTGWFIAAMFAFGVLLMLLIYRLRVAQISRQMSARFDERLAERTRVAREIHDTLLQTVQGSKMVADHALKNSTDHTRMVRAMEQLATWLEQATDEGRAALHSLRSSTTEKNDLAEAFRRAIDECGVTAETAFSVNGPSQEMHPVVRDEIYRIGYEAIRNSCAHSGAGRLEITLDYAHDLTLRVSDDGVGIDSEVLEKGKDGHFGIGGMRERAERIGADLTLISSPDSGCVVNLVVPGRIAFRASRPTWSQRVKALFHSGGTHK